MFISGAGSTDVLVVMARTGEEGLRAYLHSRPANADRIEYGKAEEKMGWNAQPTRMITFDNVKLDASWLLGEKKALKWPYRA